MQLRKSTCATLLCVSCAMIYDRFHCTSRRLLPQNVAEVTQCQYDCIKLVSYVVKMALAADETFCHKIFVCSTEQRIGQYDQLRSHSLTRCLRGNKANNLQAIFLQNFWVVSSDVFKHNYGSINEFST